MVAVLQALEQKDDVSNGVVNGQQDGGEDEPLQNRPQNVEDVTYQPYDDELDGKPLRGASAVVFVYLGEEDNYPAVQRDGP